MRSRARPWWSDWKWDDEVRRDEVVWDHWFELNCIIRCRLPGWSTTFLVE